MLSPKVADVYEKLHGTLAPAMRQPGMKLRIEETNNFYLGGAAHASDTFAAGLWAARGVAGLNFHTSDLYPLTPDAKATWYVAFAATAGRQGYAARPLAYALTAFNAAGPVRSVPVTLGNPDGVNVSAYATLSRDGTLVLTIINKSHGNAGRAVNVRLPAGSMAVQTLALVAPAVDATEGVKLGGSPIANDGTWRGRFRPHPAGAPIVVPPASALVVRVAPAALPRAALKMRPAG